MKNKSAVEAIKDIVNSIKRYTVTIFIVLIVSGLSYAVILLNTILQDASDTTGIKSSLDNSGFDQATIERVKQLHTSDEKLPDLALPTERVNPFAE